MPSAPPIPPDQLLQRLHQARANRASISDRRRTAEEAEVRLAKGLEGTEPVSVEHPCADVIEHAAPGALGRLEAAFAAMRAAEQRVQRHAKGAKRNCDQAATLTEQRASRIRLGLLTFVFVIGIIILLVNFDRKAIEAAERAAESDRCKELDARQRLQEARDAGCVALQEASAASAAHFERVLLAHDAEWCDALASLPPFLRASWSMADWKRHDLSQSLRLPFLCTGMWRDPSAPSYVEPCLGPLLGQSRLLRLTGRSERTLPLVHGVIIQLAAMLPYGATFTLLDPSGAGRGFPMQRSLPFVRRVGADMYRDLEQLLEDITRIIQTYLDGETQSFEQLPDEIQANERFEFVVAANFPRGYDRRTIEALQRIARNGPAAGKYLVLQMAPGEDLPRDLVWDDFGPLWSLDVDTRRSDGAVLEPLDCPASAQALVLELLAASKPPETRFAWADFSEADPERWWRETADSMAMAAIGSSGRDRTLNVWFGANRDGRPCAHGVLGAMTGSGKSNLYHVLICGLAIRYSPEELNLYLIDGKVGVEFQPYRRLPHARVVALHSAPELSRSVLEELIAEMKRRNEVFKRLDVADLAGYRARRATQGALPPLARIVLLVDEYQELFEDDRHGLASAALLQLAQQGRSAGVHLLLGSQRFGAVGMLHQTAIFGNIHLRMAMKMSQSDVLGLTEFGRNGRRLIESCDLPGKIVINDQSGEDSKNEFGKVALLEASERAVLLRALESKADRDWPAARRLGTAVFDGQAQPNFAENPQVVEIVRSTARPGANAWRAIAVAPAHERGLGVQDWFVGERPMALWLGQELNVHGQARIVLRRRPMENVLLVGENQAALYGMLLALVSSAVLHEAPADVRFWLGDRAVPGTPWHSATRQAVERLLRPLDYEVARSEHTKEITSWLDAWLEELERREALDEESQASQPTWLLLLAGAERLSVLMRVPGKFNALEDTPEGDKLRRICRRGPSVGLHAIMTFSSAGPLRQALDRGQLEQFKHRVVTQMSEGDSFQLIGKDSAARLQRGNARPVFAIYQDAIGGTWSRFKPYDVEAEVPWCDQLDELTECLARWHERVALHG